MKLDINKNEKELLLTALENSFYLTWASHINKPNTVQMQYINLYKKISRLK